MIFLCVPKDIWNIFILKKNPLGSEVQISLDALYFLWQSPSVTYLQALKLRFVGHEGQAHFIPSLL